MLSAFLFLDRRLAFRIGDDGLLRPSDGFQFEAQLVANGGGGAMNCVELDLAICRVEKAVELGAACAHPLRHRDFGQDPGLYRLGDLYISA